MATAQASNDRLHYDAQCVTIDGHDLVLFSGAFHYFRCPEELWADRFRKLKEAGFNTVETYAAWNWHEPNPPKNPDDFSKVDMTDLRDWLAMATDQFGFYVYLRPGPYICAEWDGGGYPQWLLPLRPANFNGGQWLRSDEPSYLAWSKHWYTAVARVAAPFQVTHRPPGKAGIILWQIENEYNYSDQSPEVKRRQLDFLAHTSRDLGIDVPLTTCLTDNAAFRADEYLKQNVIETRNSYPKFSMTNMARDITMLDRYQPEKFRMISELQGGWFAQVGGKLSEAQGFDATHINHITLFAWEHGFTSTNYYMGFGGTNFGDWAADSLTTTYDYDAPVRECGGVTERYLAVKALGNFIAEHGPQLARSVDEKFDATQKSDNEINIALRRAKDGSRFLFVRTEQRSGTKQGSVKLRTTGGDVSEISASYELGPYGAKVLYLPAGASSDSAGSWYPKPVDPPARPAQLPAAVTVTDARMQVDAGPTQWKAISAGEGLESAGIFNRGFVYYRATVSPPPANEDHLALAAHARGRDWVGFAINGKRMLADERTGNVSLDSSMAGQPLIGVFENAGRPNFGKNIDRPSGLLDLRVTPSSSAPRQLSQWRMKHVDANRQPPEAAADVDDAKWTKLEMSQETVGDLAVGQNAIYRTTVDLSDAEARTPKSLTLGRVDDEGVVFVNGQKVGECHDWAQAQTIDVSKALRPGKNVIAVLVINRDGPGGLGHGAWLGADGPALPVQWEISDQFAGVTGRWWEPTFDDAGWRSTKIGNDSVTPVANAPLLTWYRARFELPEPNPHAWVPWRAHLDLTGNGYLYLNGHPLGRWWQAGPQRDFYLPECWLQFGPGKSNVLTMSLRPTDRGVGIRGIEIGPYERMAEQR